MMGPYSSNYPIIMVNHFNIIVVNCICMVKIRSFTITHFTTMKGSFFSIIHATFASTIKVIILN